jgi:hypothetical protein
LFPFGLLVGYFTSLETKNFGPWRNVRVRRPLRPRRLPRRNIFWRQETAETEDPALAHTWTIPFEAEFQKEGLRVTAKNSSYIGGNYEPKNRKPKVDPTDLNWHTSQFAIEEILKEKNKIAKTP